MNAAASTSTVIDLARGHLQVKSWQRERLLLSPVEAPQSSKFDIVMGTGFLAIVALLLAKYIQRI